MKTLTTKTYQDLALDGNDIVLEPSGKNTAPAVALVCHLLLLKNQGDVVVGIFPADHLIDNEAEFHKSLNLAVSCAEAGQIVTLGIQPHFPSTGFGYIEVADQKFKSANNLHAFPTRAFHEKPNRARAEEFIASGKFFLERRRLYFQSQ